MNLYVAYHMCCFAERFGMKRTVNGATIRFIVNIDDNIKVRKGAYEYYIFRISRIYRQKENI